MLTDRRLETGSVRSIWAAESSGRTAPVPSPTSNGWQTNDELLCRARTPSAGSAGTRTDSRARVHGQASRQRSSHHPESPSATRTAKPPGPEQEKAGARGLVVHKLTGGRHAGALPTGRAAWGWGLRGPAGLRRRGGPLAKILGDHRPMQRVEPGRLSGG